jgi:cbb3-type cytochrome oxidase maturation protein
MSFYYVPWVILIAISLWISLEAFLWAHRHGQFDDQERARYLALRDEQNMAQPKHTAGAIREVYIVFVILLIGALSMTAVILTIILKNRGMGP